MVTGCFGEAHRLFPPLLYAKNGLAMYICAMLGYKI